MNWHKLLGFVIPIGTAIIELPKLTWQGVVVTVATAIGTYIVRPSQTSAVTGIIAAKIPGKRDQNEEPPTGA